MTGVPFFEDYEAELREEHGAADGQVVTVSGLVGVGTSTIASFLADRLDFSHEDAGQFFRDKAAEYGMDIREFDERQEELEAEHGIDFDVMWDRTALRYAFTRDGIVLEGRLTGAIIADLAPVRVWVTCDEEVAARRIKDREDLSLEAAREYIRTRNAEVLERYQEKYGVDPRDDRFYNVTIDNSGSREAVKETLIEKVRANGFDL